MRLDKFLKISRLIKRRTVANEACDGGKISVNGRTARASYEVKINDIIEMNFGGKKTTVRVLDLSERVGKDVSGLYEVVI
jgi:ribosomal 50S subunit-recycling heat shock protein